MLIYFEFSNIRVYGWKRTLSVEKLMKIFDVVL